LPINYSPSVWPLPECCRKPSFSDDALVGNPGWYFLRTRQKEGEVTSTASNVASNVTPCPAVSASVPASLLREQALVGGRWTEALSGRTFDVFDPATGTPLTAVPAMDVRDARLAIDAAAAAQPRWRETPARDRARVLRRWADLLLEREGELAALLTAEQGKPLAEARAEIVSAASFLEWFGEEAKRVYGQTIPSPDPSRRIVVLKQPIGVCAGITPWNFPASMITRKAAPALAAGCTFVLKPAEQTPLTALALAAVGVEAGLPDGVLNVITVAGADAPKVGRELTTNGRVRKVTFTGSTEVGKLLMAQSATTVKKVSLELGGNAPFIVFDDANLDDAITGALGAKFRNAGQMCIAANRILVADDVYDDFVDRLTAAATGLRVGPGAHEGTEIGPLIDQAAVAKAQQHVDDAVARGAAITVGGGLHEVGGQFFAPTVITGVPPTALMANEETFAPVAGLIRFSSDEEAIRLANDTPYGLSAYIYTRDLGRSWRVAEALEYGMVGLNTPVIASESTPFGGMKESGIGREGSHYGLDEFLEVKCFFIGGLG
jgi:succinate-semialdehyde dehydrogenase/glutarate-semialdehyde dehydrogenase